MSNSILLQNLSKEDLGKLIDERLSQGLEKLNSALVKKEIGDILLCRDEVCKLFQIDSSTLWHWTNKGKVKAYGIGNRRYYKKSELLESLTPVKK
ncbi:helix-turn-helix domain-containing protein [Maribacter sp. ANRC-HE7]|uniref:Helix-turn-helix domain-containing protein n=1 Tax=Maribacter aquimaris TaxID=2737171 RepID=A0ABR7V524_9FLAO|nr:helix-turn-helix domain-containing protein [Maribacter aquimaris]MBD0778248.1 helix-turn-helix domain-containing protein [Maribacter aquimaris]